MTFVAAKRFGERIIVISDTMISDLTGTKDNIIPGALKSVVLNLHMTVAYAGLADQGLDAIIRARRSLEGGGNTSGVEKILAEATQKHFGMLEFIVVSHGDGVNLKRIWDGNISSNLDQTCIGQRDLLSAILAQEGAAQLSIIPHPFEDEVPFSTAFRKLFNGIYVSDGVGGFGITTICSPYGHCYSNYGGVSTWDVVSIRQGVTEEQLADRRSGKTQWSYNINGAKLRGVGVVGALIPDAGIGYIYAPITGGGPIKWQFERPLAQDQHVTILNAFQKQIDEAADEVGGGVDVKVPAPIIRPPTDREFEQIITYSKNALLPTTLTMIDGAISVSCKSDKAFRTVRVGFAALGSDPISVLKTVIDRLNYALIASIKSDYDH